MSTYKKKKIRKKSRAKSKKIPPEKQYLLNELCEICKKIGVDVRLENGRFQSGYCIVEGKELFYLNKNHWIDLQIDALLSYLKTKDLNNMYISPQLRFFIEEQDLVMRE